MTHKNTAWKAPLEVTPCSPPLAAAQQMSRGSVSMSLAVPRMAPLGASSVPTMAGWNTCWTLQHLAAGPCLTTGLI